MATDTIKELNASLLADHIVAKINKQEYVGYATVKQFAKLSGITPSDIETKLLTNLEFRRNCVRRFEDGRTNYIKLSEAMKVVERLLLEVD